MLKITKKTTVFQEKVINIKKPKNLREADLYHILGVKAQTNITLNLQRFTVIVVTDRQSNEFRALFGK